jgi:hypothetical protein
MEEMAKLKLNKKHVQEGECKLRWTKKQQNITQSSILFEFF